MGRTAAADVLGELEAIGALGDEPQIVHRAEEKRLEAGAPSGTLVDARGPLMVEVCERIADKLDRSTEFLDGAAKMLQDLKNEILEMKKIWEPPMVEEREVEEVEEGDNNLEDDDGEVHETP